MPAPSAQSGPLSLPLVCHPTGACPAVRSLQARANLLDSGVIAVGFTLFGDLEDLVLPLPAAPEFTDRLWEHTCFETFLTPTDTEAYQELNLSPSTAWAAYAFEAYRVGGRPSTELAPRIVAHARPGRLEMHALTRLPEAWQGRELRLGLTAVLESRTRGLSYWALKHTETQPDFHRRASFTLVLPPWIEE